MINFSICVSDIPKEVITIAKNGKKYVNLTLVPLKAKDEYGRTHTIYLTQSKEDREAKKTKTYVGSGRELNFEKTAENSFEKEVTPEQTDSDLPF